MRGRAVSRGGGGGVSFLVMGGDEVGGKSFVLGEGGSV